MRKMKYFLRIGILFAVIAALVIGLAVPTLAKSNNGPETTRMPAVRTVQGKVVSITSDNLSFTIQNTSGNITVSVNATTTYYVVPVGRVQPAVDNGILQGKNKESGIPSNWRDNVNWLDKFLKKGQFSDIEIGDRVIARIGTSDNMARQVLIIKGPVIRQVKGTITDVSTNPNSITISSTSGLVTLSWNTNTQFILKGLIAVVGNAGQYATVTYNKNTGVAQIVNVLPAAPTP
jgi:hypothetical protein